MAQAGNLIYDTRSGETMALRVTNAAVLYSHTLVGRKAGLAIEWDGSDTAMEFLGLNGHKVTGDTSAGDPPKATVDVSGVILRGISVTGASAITNNGALVYASDGDTFTLTATANAKPVGTVERWHTGTTCDVRLNRFRDTAGGIAALTEDGGAIGGTNDGDLPDLTVTTVLSGVDTGTDMTAAQAATIVADITGLVAAVRELATKVNENAARI